MNALRWPALNLACLFGYVALGKLGLLISLPPGYASAIWPAAGLAFAALVMGGWRLAPGLFLGSLLVNMTVTGQLKLDIVAVGIALGSTLQALVGAYLLRWRNPTLLLDRPQRVLQFALIGTLSCVIAASCGNAVLLAFGPLQWSQVPQSFLTWWLGDAFGVQIFTPLILLLLGRGHSFGVNRLSVGLPILLAFGLCGLTYLMVRDAEERQLQRQFSTETAALASRLVSGDQQIIHALRQMSLNYTVRGELPGAEFDQVAKAVLNDFVGVRAVSWARLEGERLQIARIVPEAANAAALGLDILASAERAKAARRALSSGHMVASDPVRLVQAPDSPGGVLLMAPLLLPQGQGLINAVFDLAWISSFIGSAKGVEWQLHDVAGGAPRLLASSRKGLVLPEFSTHTWLDRHGVYLQQDFHIADRHWNLVLFRDHALHASESGYASLAVLFFAFTACSIFSGFMLMLAGDRARIAGQVAEQTRALQEEIAERGRIESELRESRQFLVDLIENSGALIFAKTRDGTYKMVNRRWEETTGLTRDKVLGHTDFDLFPPDIAAAFRANDVAVMESGTMQESEEILDDAQGRRYFLSIKFPVRNVAGEITGMCAITSEITERKRHEQELAQAKEAAEAANLAKSRFLATMSHELRTPMNGILGMAQLLIMDDSNPEERKEYLRTILGSGKALMTILNDILDLSKIEAGRMELHSTVFDPLALLDETATLFRESAAQKGLSLRVAAELPPLRVLGDPLRLRQMLSNLTGNAVKFSERGEIVIGLTQVAAADLPADALLLEFSVRDQGIGIPADKLGSLFRPFSQVDDSATRRFGGTGLGLSIVRRLAEQMHGEVGVDSVAGSGSRFWFRVRLQRAAPAQESRQAPRAPGPVSSPPGRWVLVAEDVAANRVVVGALLQKLGLEARFAENGAVALDLLARHADDPPGAVLMDGQMPVLDGYAATAQIRADEQRTGRAHLPIIALTADAFADDRQRCLAAGMDDFLAKPLVFDELTAALRRAGVLAPSSH